MDSRLFQTFFDDLEAHSFQTFEERWTINMQWLTAHGALAAEFAGAHRPDPLRHHVAALSLKDPAPPFTTQQPSSLHAAAAAGSFSLFSTVLPTLVSPLDLPAFVPRSQSTIGSPAIDADRKST